MLYRATCHQAFLITSKSLWIAPFITDILTLQILELTLFPIAKAWKIRMPRALPKSHAPHNALGACQVFASTDLTLDLRWVPPTPQISNPTLKNWEGKKWTWDRLISVSQVNSSCFFYFLFFSYFSSFLVCFFRSFKVLGSAFFRTMN